jgi:UDP-glucose 4-epimerase
MRKGEKLTIVSPGSQLRNFTHVDDIVEGLLLVGENGHGDEYGIGHPDSYTVLEIAQMFGGEIEMLRKRPGNRMSADVITDKTIALGWKARMNIEDYINDEL